MEAMTKVVTPNPQKTVPLPVEYVVDGPTRQIVNDGDFENSYF